MRTGARNRSGRGHRAVVHGVPSHFHASRRTAPDGDVRVCHRPDSRDKSLQYAYNRGYVSTRWGLTRQRRDTHPSSKRSSSSLSGRLEKSPSLLSSLFSLFSLFSLALIRWSLCEPGSDDDEQTTTTRRRHGSPNAYLGHATTPPGGHGAVGTTHPIHVGALVSPQRRWL